VLTAPLERVDKVWDKVWDKVESEKTQAPRVRSHRSAAEQAAFLSSGWLLLAILLTALLATMLLPSLAKLKAAVTGRGASGTGRVVVYTSQDQVYAEPILKEFERQTGVKTAVVYDSEAVKTVGLANRLLAERNHPQCDVFWNNEELRTRQLAAQGVFRTADPWIPLGYRSRRIIINTNHLSLAAAPKSLSELTNQTWRGKVALAYPLFGTTATHFLALRQHWGPVRWERWCRALASNKPFLVDGNSVAAQLVGRGEAWIGLTDSDDFAAERRDGAPLAALPMNDETLLIPNTVAIVRGAPHPDAAQKLLDYLRQPAIVRKLVEAQALEGLSTSEVPTRTLRPDWEALLGGLTPATEILKSIFLR
jgi:iron(III) transport system substrate-binding protein